MRVLASLPVISLALLSYTPKPVTVSAGPISVAVMAVVAGAVYGTSSGILVACKNGKCHSKRDIDLDMAEGNVAPILAERGVAPPGVPQFNFDMCTADLVKAPFGTPLITPLDGKTGILITGVPATCMTLATVIAGDPVNGPYPVPMGSDSLQYNNLTPVQYNDLMQAFGLPF